MSEKKEFDWNNLLHPDGTDSIGGTANRCYIELPDGNFVKGYITEYDFEIVRADHLIGIETDSTLEIEEIKIPVLKKAAVVAKKIHKKE